MKIGINGFGRIGRLILRSALARGIDLDVVAINDRGDAEINAHLFKFDSTYGPLLRHVEACDGQITIDERPIRIVSHLNPLDIPRRELGVELERAATEAEVNNAFATAACSQMAGVLGYTDLPLVSSDFRGDSRSTIVDGLMTSVLSEERMMRVVGWYDNEWGYASRVADLAYFISHCMRRGHSIQDLQRGAVAADESIRGTVVI